MSIRLFKGDNIAALKTMEAESVDSVVTDPPYGLSFMGKKWDHDVPSVEFWTEVYRVLKPGGHVLSFSGTRTYHRMVVNIEDAGFEIRDQIGWLFGSGFPKSLDVSKAIDKAAGAEREVIATKRVRGGGTEYINKSNAAKHDYRPNDYQKGENVLDISAPATPEARQWEGWGTALKPAWEPCVVARKPLVGTVAENVLAHGTGALNIDGCRVATNGEKIAPRGSMDAQTDIHEGWSRPWQADKTKSDARLAKAIEKAETIGRWPANIIHDGSDEVEDAFAAFGTSKDGVAVQRNGGGQKIGGNGIYGGSEGLVREDIGYNGSGTVSRFFYCAKASKKDRAGSKHPTVKPVALMAYLCKLVTPPGGVILDPFAGSGTTGQAALDEGFKAILIEREPEYIEDIKNRFVMFLDD